MSELSTNWKVDDITHQLVFATSPKFLYLDIDNINIHIGFDSGCRIHLNQPEIFLVEIIV